MKRWLWLAPALAAAALAQTNSAPAREGAYWVDTVSGSVPAEDSLRVAMLGAVRVQGDGAGSVVTYSLKRRAKAGDLASAQRLLGTVVVRSHAKAGWTFLEVEAADPRRASADLQLHVPRSLKETAVVSSGGAIQVAGLDGSVTAETAGGAVGVESVAGAVVVRTGGGAVRLVRIGGKVECFSGGGAILAEFVAGEVHLKSRGGAITIRNVKAPVVARTLGGNVVVERAAGEVQVSAGAGLIDIVEAGGPVMAETGAGSISVRAASNVRCESAAGTIQLQAISGGLHATTKLGSIMASFGGAKALQESALATAMGDITVLIPSNLAVTVEAINRSPGGRRIVSDFAEVRPRLEQGAAGTAAQGAINGGGPRLQLTASGGMIYLRRQK